MEAQDRIRPRGLKAANAHVNTGFSRPPAVSNGTRYLWGENLRHWGLKSGREWQTSHPELSCDCVQMHCC